MHSGRKSTIQHTHTHTVSALKIIWKIPKRKKRCRQKPQWRCTKPTHTHSHMVSAAAGGTHTHILRLSGISFSRRSDDMDVQQQWEGSVSTGQGDYDGAGREEHQKHFLLNCFAKIHKQRRSVFLPLEGRWLCVRSFDVFSSVLHFVAYFTKFKNFKFKCSISNRFFGGFAFPQFSWKLLLLHSSANVPATHAAARNFNRRFYLFLSSFFSAWARAAL